MAKTKTIETLLKDAGFKTISNVNERVIHASGVKDFGGAHAAVLQAACNCPEFHGCSRLPIATGYDILVVHVAKPETPDSEPSTPTSKPETE